MQAFASLLSRLHIPLVCALVGLVSCSRHEKIPVNLPILTFNVVDSLLADRVVDSTLAISYRPPRGWKRFSESVVDSALKRARGAVAQMTGGNLHVLAAYGDNESAAVFVAVRLDSSFQADSIATDVRIVQYLNAEDSTADTRQDAFMCGPFAVQQFMTVSANEVSLKLIFDMLGQKSPMFEWDFRIPKSVYPDKARIIESIVGSLQPINPSTNTKGGT